MGSEEVWYPLITIANHQVKIVWNNFTPLVVGIVIIFNRGYPLSRYRDSVFMGEPLTVNFEDGGGKMIWIDFAQLWCNHFQTCIFLLQDSDIDSTEINSLYITWPKCSLNQLCIKCTSFVLQLFLIVRFPAGYKYLYMLPILYEINGDSFHI